MIHKDYSSLVASPLHTGSTFHLPEREASELVRLEDRAVEVMTDFSQVRAITIPSSVSMESAYQRMIANGVRLLLVVDERNAIQGLITARDVEGERPLQQLRDRGLRRSDLTVADVMTPASQIEVLDLADVVRARVGDIVATLQAMGRQHAMVADRDDQGRTKVRGLFSATQISRQLSTPIQTLEVARNFAQVARMLAH